MKSSFQKFRTGVMVSGGFPRFSMDAFFESADTKAVKS